MEKVIVHEFDPVIYPRKVWIVVTNNPQILTDHFNYIDDSDNSPFDTAHAFVFDCKHRVSGLKGTCICFTKKNAITFENVSHESVHIASSIFNDLGMTIGFNGGRDEHFAYLVGWVADCCNQVRTNKFK